MAAPDERAIWGPPPGRDGAPSPQGHGLDAGAPPSGGPPPGTGPATDAAYTGPPPRAPAPRTPVVVPLTPVPPTARALPPQDHAALDAAEAQARVVTLGVTIAASVVLLLVFVFALVSCGVRP